MKKLLIILAIGIFISPAVADELGDKQRTLSIQIVQLRAKREYIDALVRTLMKSSIRLDENIEQISKELNAINAKAKQKKKAKKGGPDN